MLTFAESLASEAEIHVASCRSDLFPIYRVWNLILSQNDVFKEWDCIWNFVAQGLLGEYSSKKESFFKKRIFICTVHKKTFSEKDSFLKIDTLKKDSFLEKDS